MLSGAFWIDKPTELTSSDVVVRLKIALTKNGYCEKGFKIGHGGTLDPFATGAMIVLVGEATKLADTYLHSVKSYSGAITLGSKTDTADFTGETTDTKEVPALMADQWQMVADTFVTEEYWQTPPMYSAKKQNGKALHQLARQGIEVERKAILKKIELFQVKPLSASDASEAEELSFDVACESGTYVRVIAEDLAVKAGTLAHLRVLTRTRSSDVMLANCSTLETVLGLLQHQTPMEQIDAFHPLKDVATHIPSLIVSSDQATLLLQGHQNTRNSIVQQFLRQLHSSTSGGRSNGALPSKYFIARLANGAPTALFERMSEANSPLPPAYRLQRVILT